MISINDHPDIRRAFDGLPMLGLEIKYAVSNTHGKPQISKELMITNWSQARRRTVCLVPKWAQSQDFALCQIRRETVPNRARRYRQHPNKR